MSGVYDVEKERERAREIFTTASKSEIDSLMPQLDYSEVMRDIGPIGKRYHEAKARGALQDEIGDIHTSCRALEYFSQMKLLCFQMIDVMELRGARFYQDKPIALEKTADMLAAVILKSINSPKVMTGDKDLDAMWSGGLDTVEELMAFFPDFHPQTADFPENDGKFIFSDESLELLIEQFTQYILSRWRRNFATIRRQIESDIDVTFATEMGTKPTDTERNMAIQLGTTTVEDDKASLRSKIIQSITNRVNVNDD